MSEAAVLDDIDARPGSTASLLRTIIGLTVRRLGGWISTADLVRLAGEAGVAPSRARTAIARVKQHGLLVPARNGAVGYRINEAAVPMLERGDRRIFTVRQMRPDDGWCLISFSIPESRRDVRHQLRRRLQWIGCGVVSAALWICPAYLQEEVEEILGELGIRDAAVLFRTETPRVAGSLAEAVATWWDLAALRREHERFHVALDDLDAPGSRPTEPGTEDPGPDAFRRYVHLIDSWRVLPYVDPGLPSDLLPTDWPGQRSFDEFRRLSDRWEGPAWEHVRATVSRPAPDLTA